MPVSVNRSGGRAVQVGMKIRALSSIAAVALFVGACGDSDDEADDTASTVGSDATSTPDTPAPDTSPPSSEAGQPGAAEIVAEGFAYDDVTVAPGATITLVNNDPEPHTVTADDGSFDSGSFESGEEAELVAPTEPGTYAFHCEIHPRMQATLTVSEEATGGSPPGSAAPPASTAGSGPAVTGSLTATDQDGDGTAVAVESVSIEGSDGFIAVHQDLEGAPGPVVGHVAVSEGDSSDVVVELDAPVESGDYWPMLHIDAGEAGSYEFPGPDVPVTSGADVVMQQISLTVS